MEGGNKIGVWGKKGRGALQQTREYTFKMCHLRQTFLSLCSQCLSTRKLPAACVKVRKQLLTAVVRNSYVLASVLLT